MKTILSKSDILQLIHAEPPLVRDYLDLEEQVQPNGFDLTLKEVARFEAGGLIAVSNSQRIISKTIPLEFNSQQHLELPPGPYLITYNEIVNLPRNVSALGAPRSSLLRCGVSVHMAVWDAGYSGRSQSLMVVHNLFNFRVQHNARVAQLVFFQLTNETEAYNGAYQGENIV